ncbi:unnamed protein product [Toxocara canis]|uniref:Uncharacterized protein n=1 Tax=Toxocara canis TaxID=6265 RepID=A0A183UPD2_TOXCA|nr:unnamed protein product [Toxocara canis]
MTASRAHNDGSPSAAEASTQEVSAAAPYGSAVPQQRLIVATQRTTDVHDLPLTLQIAHKTSPPPKERGHPRKRSSTENNDDVNTKKVTAEMEMKSKPKQNAYVNDEITQATQEISSAPKPSKHADKENDMKKERPQMRASDRKLSQTQTEQSNSEKHEPSSCETTQSTSRDISLMGDHESAFDADDWENWKYLDTLDDVKSIEKEETPSPR